MTELPAGELRRAESSAESETKARSTATRDRAAKQGRRLVKPLRKSSEKRSRGGESRPSGKKTRAMRVALFASRALARDFNGLAESDEVELVHFETSRLSRAAWSAHPPFDAVIVEHQRKSGEAGVVRWLRKNAPDVPLIAFGNRASGRGSRSVYAFSLSEVPRAGVLRSLLVDARRHLESSRKAAKLSHRLRDTSRQLQVLGDIVSTANSILEPRRVVNVIMSQIQELIPSEAWSILLVDETTGELTFEMALGEKSADLNDTRIKIGEGIAGWVAETGEPTVVNDVRRDRRFQGRFDELTHFQTRSILCAPLISRGRIIGVVEIMNRASRSRFTKKDLNLLLTLVEPAAIALENAILFQKTQKLAVTDDLTKLYNSRYLNGFLEEALARAKRFGSSLAVMFLDLDGFKGINDRYGHFYGSRTLTEAGGLLRSTVREEDVVSRYGGDEFVVVLPDTDAAGAVAVAERIRAALKDHAFLSEFGLDARLSASFGLSLYPDHGDNPQDLMQKADQAMYSVKEQGKDAVCLA